MSTRTPAQRHAAAVRWGDRIDNAIQLTITVGGLLVLPGIAFALGAMLPTTLAPELGYLPAANLVAIRLVTGLGAALIVAGIAYAALHTAGKDHR